jgi:hypothetical protein
LPANFRGLLAVVVAGIAPMVAPGVGAVAAQTVAAPFSHTIEPRQIAEECFKLPARQTIGYSFEATGPVDFNIHFHRGTDIHFPVQAEQVRRADDRFTAPSTEEFCLMWTNPSSMVVTVRGDLAR